MKISAKFASPRIDISKYRQALKASLSDAILYAALEWVLAVTDAIPSWSGASRATMQHLASKAGFSVEISISSPPSVGDRTSLGFANATGDIITEKADEGIVSFYYSTTLPHLIWNEFNNANVTPDVTKWKHAKLRDPGPYNFQEKGAKAVKQVFDRVTLPNPGDFMLRGKPTKV